MRKQGNPQQGHEAEKAELHRRRMIRLEEGFSALQGLLHELEGSQSGAYGTREMAIAGTHLETAWLWAREAIEE